MKRATIPLLVISMFCPALSLAQTQWVGASYFPADFEFVELTEVVEKKEIVDASSISRIRDGLLFKDVGFERYSMRAYSISATGRFEIEIVQLKDPRAAYSLLTLLRSSPITAGSPGASHSASARELIFVQDNHFVRLRASHDGDLLTRVARSVSNRIGSPESSSPALLSHFPDFGFDSGSIRYFVSPRATESFATAVGGGRLRLDNDVELAQARYSIREQSGLLSLFSFPTGQLAEDFLERVSQSSSSSDSGIRIYAKRSGPVLGILEGTFDPGTADDVLSRIQYSYTIKWIFDKHNRSSGTVWGVPVGILGTVVRSLLLTAVLCTLSVLGGVAFAFFRITLRRYAPHNVLDRPERTEMIRLKIDES